MKGAWKTFTELALLQDIYKKKKDCAAAAFQVDKSMLDLTISFLNAEI